MKSQCADSFAVQMVSAKGEADFVWGSRHVNALNGAGVSGGAQGETGSDVDDYGPDEGGFDDDDDDEYGAYGHEGGFDFEALSQQQAQIVVPSGLEIAVEGGLLQAARTVEKVSIG